MGWKFDVGYTSFSEIGFFFFFWGFFLGVFFFFFNVLFWVFGLFFFFFFYFFFLIFFFFFFFWDDVVDVFCMLCLFFFAELSEICRDAQHFDLPSQCRIRYLARSRIE